MRRTLALYAPLLAILMLCPAESWAAEPPVDNTAPVTLDALRQMRRERMTFRQMVEAIDQRGLGFAVDADAQRRLRALGFSPKLIAQLKGMRAVEVPAAAESPPAGRPPGDALGNQPPTAAPAPPPGTHRVLDAATESDYKGTAERVAKIVSSSGTSVAAHPTAHINLLSNPKIAQQVSDVVQQLEQLIAKRFPDPIGSGVDPRAANIVLLENRYEYEKWMRALFKVHQESGLKFQGDDPLQSALASNAVFVPGIFSVNLAGMDGEAIRRRLAFAVGYLYMRQLTNNHAPEALQTGFGNLTEVMLFHEPGTTVVSGYTDRQLSPSRERWIDMVRKRFAEHKQPTLAVVLAYSTQTMNVEHYAESWTLTTLLATDPARFAELVARLGKGEAADTTLNEVYGLKEDALVKRWTRFVLSGR